LTLYHTSWPCTKYSTRPSIILRHILAAILFTGDHLYSKLGCTIRILWKREYVQKALLLTLVVASSVFCDRDFARVAGPADGLDEKNEILAREPQRTTIRIISLYPGLTSVRVRDEPSFLPAINRYTKTNTPSVSSFTTLPPKPVSTKTGLKNCHIQGTSSATLNSNILGSQHASDALACQLQCMFVSRCEAYSFQPPATSKIKNCIKYLTTIGGSAKVDPSSSSGIFFSDKYPSDGSNFCYSDVPL